MAWLSASGGSEGRFVGIWRGFLQRIAPSGLVEHFSRFGGQVCLPEILTLFVCINMINYSYI